MFYRSEADIWNQKIDGSKPVSTETLVATPLLRKFGDLVETLCSAALTSLKPLLADSNGPSKSYTQILSKFVQMDFVSLLQDHCRSVLKLLKDVEVSKAKAHLTLQSIYIGRSAILLKDRLNLFYKSLCPKDDPVEITNRISAEINLIYTQSHKFWILNTCQSTFDDFLKAAKQIQWDNDSHFVYTWEGTRCLTQIIRKTMLGRFQQFVPLPSECFYSRFVTLLMKWRLL